MTHTILMAPQLDAVNANERLHYHAKAQKTKAWRSAANLAAETAGVPALDRARIVITVSFPDKRRRDVHNLYPTAKAIVDGLVDAGVLPDDDDRRLIGPDMRRGPKTDGGPPVWRVDIHPIEDEEEAAA